MTNEELVTAIQNGNNDLMWELWKQCKGFVCQQAFRWSKAWGERADFDIDDLIQSGYIALCDAVKGYQEGRGGFISYLSFYLKTEFSELARCRYEAQTKEPLNGAISLDAPAYNDSDNDTTIGDTIPAADTGFEAVEDIIYNQQISAILKDAVSSIPKQQGKSIDLYYIQGKTQKETADLLNISVCRVQQVIQDGLKNLRRSSYIPTLTEIYYGDRNFYKGTGYISYKHSGTSSPEREAINKEYIENKYRVSKWIGKVGILIEYFGCTIERAQVIATLDSVSA